MLNIGIAGCSHSGYSYGNPWTYYMSQNLGAQIIDVSANEINFGHSQIRFLRISNN